jgi:hypothetical protein
MLLTALWVGRRDRKRKIAGLLFVLTAFAVCSLLGIAIRYEGSPGLWWQEFWMKFGR